MRLFLLLAAMPLLALAACRAAPPPDASQLTIADPYWERVNVEFVITKREDCDSRAEGYISTKKVLMHKNVTELIVVPSGATLCWRHDLDPSKPAAGAWSSWTRATPTPGESGETSL